MKKTKEKTSKERILEYLAERNATFVSGQEIADTLFLTRAAVWKTVKTLQENGYFIEAVSNRGYRLVLEKDVLLKSSIDKILLQKNVSIDTYVYDEVASTNDTAREMAVKEMPEAVIISDYQTNGRGRRGREFFSPKGSGLYMSFLLRPNMDISEATKVTCMAAVAVCRAIEAVVDIKPKIKWVNDIFVDDKKVCGILTEGYTSIEDGSLTYVIVGIGINMYMPAKGFPESIKKTAGVLLPKGQTFENIRNNLCATIISEFIKLYNGEDSGRYIEEYKSRSMLTGHFVKIMQAGKTAAKDYAKVKGIDDDCHLIVEYEDGREECLSTGEVSVVKY